jgi:hypothetical protein
MPWRRRIMAGRDQLPAQFRHRRVVSGDADAVFFVSLTRGIFVAIMEDVMLE